MTESLALPFPAHDATSVAFEDVYATELPYVWHSLRRLGVRDAEREDLAHDVFMVVHRRLHTFDASRPIRPWLFGIAFRVVSDHRRSARVRREVLDDSPELRADAGPAPDAQRIADDKRRLLSAALDTLSLERRAVFVMFEMDEVPMSEIAEALSMPRNTCYSHLRRARRELAQAVTRLQAKETNHG